MFSAIARRTMTLLQRRLVVGEAVVVRKMIERNSDSSKASVDTEAHGRIVFPQMNKGVTAP